MRNSLTSMTSSLPKKKVWETSKLILRGQNTDRLGRKPPTTIMSNISRDFPFSTGVAETLRGSNMISQSCAHSFKLIPWPLQNFLQCNQYDTKRHCDMLSKKSRNICSTRSCHITSPWKSYYSQCVISHECLLSVVMGSSTCS